MFCGKHLGKSGVGLDAKPGVQVALAQVGVHQQHARTAHGQRDGEVRRRDGFAVAGNGTGDEQVCADACRSAPCKAARNGDCDTPPRRDGADRPVARRAGCRPWSPCVRAGSGPRTSSSNNSCNSVNVFMRSSTRSSSMRMARPKTRPTTPAIIMPFLTRLLSGNASLAGS